MSKRAAIAAAFSVVALTVAGCGGDDAGGSRPASLVWDGKPKLYIHPTLKDDRILRGEVKNGGLDKVRIETADVKLLDADGREVPGIATFAPAYVHSLYTRNRLPRGGYPEEEKRRIGLVAVLQPGKTASLTVSWRRAARPTHSGSDRLRPRLARDPVEPEPRSWLARPSLLAFSSLFWSRRREALATRSPHILVARLGGAVSGPAYGAAFFSATYVMSGGPPIEPLRLSVSAEPRRSSGSSNPRCSARRTAAVRDRTPRRR